MRGIWLSALSVSHFRGISDSIVFDFSSPLTLVFAPNGTGKTTMCEATEWLLTGQVERLKEGNGFDATVLRSKFTEDLHTPSAAADLYIDGQRRFVTRFVEGTQSLARFGNDIESASAYRPNELLALLAPAAAANETHPLAAINLRQRWLKGTRFLSAEALAALVDTDEETIERRTQVFADLLGIRHLLDAERQCEKYAGELATRLRSLDQLIARESAEADALELALTDEEMAGQETKISARSEASAASELLASEELPQAKEQANLDDLLEALTAVQRRQRHALDLRIIEAQRVEAQWSMRPTLEHEVNEGAKLEAKLTQSLTEMEIKGREAAARLAAYSSQRDVASEATRSLAAAKDQLAHLSAVLIATLHEGGALDVLPQSLAALSVLYPESSWTASARAKRRSDLAALEAALGQAADQSKRLRLLEADLVVARSRQVTEEVLAVLRSNVVEADSRIRAAVTLLDAMAEPVERLQAAARDLLEHDHEIDAAKCPICSHDWGDADHLRSAIADTLSAAPEFVETARTAVTVASDSAATARARLTEALEAQAQVLELEKELSILGVAGDALRRQIEQLALEQGASTETVRTARVNLNIADALANLLTALDSISPTLPGGPLLTLESQVDDLIDQLEMTTSARGRVVQHQLAELAKKIEAAILERDEIRASYAAVNQSLHECRKTQHQKLSALAVLRMAWEKAAPGAGWSDAALTSLMTELDAEAQRLSRAEGHIEAARAAWSAESRRIRLQELRRAIQPSLDRQKHMQGQIAAANRARAVFYDAYTTMSRKQVQDLSRVVNPLFARMHANRVFDRINLGEDNDFLHWLADAGGQQLDPGKDFSQGQRQDLALALFLARARSLGGTFFLDEPITHLDDLNRVGLLDILRATVLENSQFLNLVITTSSRALARHLIEKFSGVGPLETPAGRVPPLKVLELEGNGRTGVRLRTIYPLS